MMYKNLIGCFVLAMFVVAVPTSADPVYSPFLSVDLNGESGPTQDGFEAWNFDRSPGTNTFTETFGDVTVTLTGINNVGSNFGSRNRGVPTPTGPDDPYFNNVYSDFLFVQLSSNTACGRDYWQFEFSGLAAGEYEFTFFSYDDAFNNAGEGPGSRHLALATVNPAEWLDTNVEPGYSYPPLSDEGGGCPIPLVGRAPNGAGPYPADLDDPYAYTDSFMVTSDGTNPIVIYAWEDFEDWAGSKHAPVNGFAIGIPEPATIALLGMGGLALLRRKR